MCFKLYRNLYFRCRIYKSVILVPSSKIVIFVFLQIIKRVICQPVIKVLSFWKGREVFVLMDGIVTHNELSGSLMAGVNGQNTITDYSLTYFRLSTI